MKTADLWIRSGLVWLIAAMFYGTYLGITEQFNLEPSHAHTALLGGVLSLLFAWLFSRQGDTAATRPARVQWALYNLAVLGMVTAFALFGTRGTATALPVMIPSALTLLATMLWIAVTVWPRRA